MGEIQEERKEAGQPQSEIQGPLKGIRVLDLGHAGAGPGWASTRRRSTAICWG